MRCRGGARGVVCKEEKLAINSNETETTERLNVFREYTYRGPDSQRHAVAALLDEVDDVGVRLVGDGAAVDRQDPVPHLQLPAAVRRAPLDDAPYFVGHGHTRISSYWSSSSSSSSIKRFFF